MTGFVEQSREGEEAVVVEVPAGTVVLVSIVRVNGSKRC